MFKEQQLISRTHVRKRREEIEEKKKVSDWVRNGSKKVKKEEKAKGWQKVDHAELQYVWSEENKDKLNREKRKKQSKGGNKAISVEFWERDNGKVKVVVYVYIELESWKSFHCICCCSL